MGKPPPVFFVRALEFCFLRQGDLGSSLGSFAFFLSRRGPFAFSPVRMRTRFLTGSVAFAAALDFDFTGRDGDRYTDAGRFERFAVQLDARTRRRVGQRDDHFSDF